MRVILPRCWSWATLLALALLGGATDSSAQERRIVRSLPRDDKEIAEAFAAAAGNVCRAVREGRSSEVHDLSPLTAGDAGLKVTMTVGGRSLPIPMARKTVLSVGVAIAPDDVATLPLISSSAIQQYLNTHYVCLQVMIRRDLDTGSLCLHDTASAACLPCEGSLLTEEFEPLVRDSLQDTRCLGLFVAADETDDAVTPGTLVFVVRNPFYDENAPGKTKPSYELLFVRAKTKRSTLGDEDLELHAFMTAEARKTLKRLPPYQAPESNTSCVLSGTVTFLGYASDGLTPAASALRTLEVRSTTEMKEEQLNALAATKSGKHHWLERPSAVLDAIIAK
ncbi:MAG: hypothetical protein C0483_10030 [Pirellula sp.]|nr:hypothetical protein [Pirellula sp.]